MSPILPSSDTATSAAGWHATLGPVASFPVAGRFEASVSIFSGTSPEMASPPLTENILVLHLGGPKRIQRGHAGSFTSHDVALGSLTTIPAMQQDRWSTLGPIEFAHLVLSPELVDQLAAEEFDLDSRDFVLLPQLGVRMPVVEHAFRSLIEASTNARGGGQLYPESLLVVLILALLRGQLKLIGDKHRTLGGVRGKSLYKGGLAGWQLRRVMDYMSENCVQDISLTDLVELVGLSRAQFFRSFKQSTGLTPHAALTRLRLDRARDLFEKSDLSPVEVAAAVGLGPTRFTALFKQYVGVSPRLYRSARL